jgi:hypothetical protein
MVEQNCSHHGWEVKKVGEGEGEKGERRERDRDRDTRGQGLNIPLQGQAHHLDLSSFYLGPPPAERFHHLTIMPSAEDQVFNTWTLGMIKIQIITSILYFQGTIHNYFSKI